MVERTIELGGEEDRAGDLGVEEEPDRGGALLVVGLVDGGQRRGGRGRGGDVVVADHGELGRDGHAALGGRVHHAEREQVGEGEHGRRRLGPVEQLAAGDQAGRAVVAGAAGDGHRAVEPRGVETGAPAGEPLAADEVEAVGLCLVERPRPVRPAHDDGEPAVAEAGEVRHHRLGAVAVVDVDAARARDRLVVDQHVGQPALLHGAQAGVVAGDGVEDEAVDQRGADQHVVGAGEQRDERHAQAARLALGGDALQQAVGGGIGQRRRERVVEDHPERAGPPARQRARRGIGAGVAELARGDEDLLPQAGGELVGTVERVRHRHPRDADVRGHGGEGGELVRLRGHRLYR